MGRLGRPPFLHLWGSLRPERASLHAGINIFCKCWSLWLVKWLKPLLWASNFTWWLAHYESWKAFDLFNARPRSIMHLFGRILPIQTFASSSSDPGGTVGYPVVGSRICGGRGVSCLYHNFVCRTFWRRPIFTPWCFLLLILLFTNSGKSAPNRTNL